MSFLKPHHVVQNTSNVKKDKKKKREAMSH